VAGRPDYQTLAATLPSEIWAGVAQTPTTDIAAGSSETIVFYSPVGTVSRVVSCHALIPAPNLATAGTHRLDIYSNGFGGFVSGTSNFGDAVEFNFGNWVSATTKAEPGSAQSWWLGRENVFDYNLTTGGTELGTQGRVYELATMVVDLP